MWTMRGIGACLLDLLFPRACAACDTALDEPGVWLCADCGAELSAAVGGDYCHCCGNDVGPYLLRDGRCAGCRNTRPVCERLFRVGRYESVLRGLVLRFKYRRMAILDALLGDMMVDVAFGPGRLTEIDALVPIPPARRRSWRRGYPPTRLLTDRVAARTGLAKWDALVLARSIREQKSLPASERAANVRGAFTVRDRERLAGAAVCLIDDVWTTGSTAREAARTLRRFGAARVCAVVLATTPVDVGVV